MERRLLKLDENSKWDDFLIFCKSQIARNFRHRKHHKNLQEFPCWLFWQIDFTQIPLFAHKNMNFATLLSHMQKPETVSQRHNQISSDKATSCSSVQRKNQLISDRIKRYNQLSNDRLNLAATKSTFQRPCCLPFCSCRTRSKVADAKVTCGTSIISLGTGI